MQNVMASCCDNKELFNSGYKKDGVEIENSHCVNCNTHWHDGIEYTKKQWEDYINNALH